MRIEKDALGSLEIPDDAYYGIQSYRASQNFPISQTQVHPALLKNYLLLKKSAATANMKIHALDEKKAIAISKAVDLLLSEDYQKLFIIDAYQAGAGTSQNMNANEVIANKAIELLGGKLGSYDIIHPNDDVNMSQSTNDTYPTAMRLATLELSHTLYDELLLLSRAFAKKSDEFDKIIKSGRTHLQDAVPIRLGQEFHAYKSTVNELSEYLLNAQSSLRVLSIGASAVGTGINVPKGFRQTIIKELRESFGDSKLKLAEDMCSATQSQLPMMIYSNALRCVAIELTRITNDLRLLSAGPANFLGEINLPSTQPGSSIMPGKVNPSILEMANQVFFKVLGNDHAMSLAVSAGQLELNVMMPLMAQVALESTHIMTQALITMRTRCIEGITANQKKCEQYAAQTSQISTVLSPIIGYAKAAELTKLSLSTHKNIIELVREQKLLTEKEIKNLLDMHKLTTPQ